MSNKLEIWLENKVESFLEETVDTIVGHYQDSLQTNEDYRGRQLLELLQNADDAYKDGLDEHKVYIELQDNKLIIKNTGQGFSKEGVESLLTSNLSPKDSNYIGNKGLGFRSILNWAKKIHISSYSDEEKENWNFSFCREYSEERFNSLPTQKQEDARKKAQNNEMYPIATLRCPKWDTIDFENTTYTTIITLDLNNYAISDIKDQFSKIDENILVFLPRLTEIHILCEAELIVYKKLINKLSETVNEVIVEKYFNDKSTLKQWTVLNEKGKIDILLENNNVDNLTIAKDYHLAVAFQDDLSDQVNHLYSFFLTEVPFHLPALVHGTFDLEGNRNKISYTKSNSELLAKLSRLLIKTAEYIAESDELASWKPLNMVYFDESKYDDRLNAFKFYDYHLKQIANSNLFPCHDGNYRYIKDTQLINYGRELELHKNIHDTLNYEKFKVLENLLLYSSNMKDQKLIKKWSRDFINEDNISKEINEISHKLQIDKRVEVIYLISKYNGFHGNQHLQLLVDDDNEIIEDGVSIYTPKTRGTLEFKIPEHVNLRFMNKELYEKLVEKFSHQFRDKNEVDSRGLQSILKSFLKVYSYEPDPVIRKIISDTNKENIEQIKLMVKALYSAFISAKETPEEITVDVPLISRNNQVISSKMLYLGYPYVGGEFIEKIYKGIEIDYLLSPFEFGLNSQYKLESFFKWLGVNHYSKKININSKTPDIISYFNWFKKNTKYDFKGNPEFVIDAISILHIKDIFMNNDIEDILYWLKVSNVLVKIKTERILFLEGYNRTNQTRAKAEELDNYSYFQWEILNIIPTITNIRKSAKDCILPDLNLDLSPVLETIKVDYKKLDKFGIERGEAKDLLHKIGIYRDFDEIDSNRIENILTSLYKLDIDGKQAKKIYRLILKKYSEYKKEELWRIRLKCENIKVYCKKGEEKNYFSSKEAFYLDELIYPKAILKNYPLIEIGIRQGQSKIKYIFDVEPLKDLDITLNQEISKDNYLNIDDDIDSVKPYILALRLKQLEGKDVSSIYQRIKDMKVKLMTSLAVNLDGEVIILDEYDYIYEKNVFYVSYKHDSLDNLRNDIQFIDLVPVLFTIAFKVTSDESKYKEIYKDKYNRKHILNSHTDNDGDRYLEEAKKLLNVRSHKLEFWNDIAVLFEIDNNIMELTNINDFFDFDMNIDKINYENLSADANFEIIKEVFADKITLNEFNEKSALNINFTKLYERILLSMFDKYRRSYKAYIWNQFNNKSVNDQSNLLKSWKLYETIVFDNIRNDFNFNTESYFSECLEKSTTILLSDINDFETINFEKDFFEFRKNKNEVLLNLLWKNNNEGLSYFKKNHHFLNENYIKLENSQSEKKDFKDDESIVPEFSENEASLPLSSSNSRLNTGTKRMGSSHIGRGNSDENSITGKSGEEIVYNFLKNDSNYVRVEWVSEYAKKAGVNSDGRDGFGYDITYWDTNDIQFFVEVKSTKTINNGETVSFHMSANEYKVAKEKKEYYKIYFVSNIGDLNPKIKSFIFNDAYIEKEIDSYVMTTSLK